MKISLEWLSRYIELDKSPQEIEEALTLIGFEVEGVENRGLPQMDKVVVGEVISSERHPNADRLSVCEVAVGGNSDNRQIVCGADNYKVGDRVPVALPGAELPGGLKIKKSKLRGITSKGMMCSPKELGLGDEHMGLLILEDRPEIGLPINEVFTNNDVVFDIEVTPNRSDCLSYIGIARELGAFFHQKFYYPEVKASSSNSDTGNNLIDTVRVDTVENCPHYRAYSIQNVKIVSSPDWLQRLLKTVGLRPINNVVDITNFVLHELGHPLHAFDASKIRGRQLIIRPAQQGEKIITLDDHERELLWDMTVIADTERALVIGGIMGSIEAEVDENTTDLVLEAAYFNPINIRRTSRTLGLSTDSSYRYERGVDPCGAEYAAIRAIDLIEEIAGGELAGSPLVKGEPSMIEREIEISPEFVCQRLGFKVENGLIQEAFEGLQLNVSIHETENGSETWNVGIPSYRLDLERRVDLVEEFLRIYGTNNIPAAKVVTPGLMREDDSISVNLNDMSDYLVGQNFNECANYSTRSEEELLHWYTQTDANSLQIANPLSSDQSHLRSSLIPGLLDNVKLNQSRGNNLRRVFESGRVYKERDGSVWELISVAFLVVQTPMPETWLAREAPDFHHAKNTVRNILKISGINCVEESFIPLVGENSWQEGHSATTGDFINGYEARVGLVSHPMLRKWDFIGTILGGEIYIQPEFLKQKREKPYHQPFSQFPPTTKDLALLVDEKVLAGKVRLDLENVARECVGSDYELESVTIFDLYQGKELPDGKKSIAFSLVFRSLGRTLTDDEVNPVFEAIQGKITEGNDYSVRS